MTAPRSHGASQAHQIVPEPRWRWLDEPLSFWASRLIVAVLIVLALWGCYLLAWAVTG